MLGLLLPASLARSCPGRYAAQNPPNGSELPRLTDQYCQTNCDIPKGCPEKLKDQCGCGRCSTHAYFPEHKVVLCTVAKASSSSWREFARRVHAIEQGLGHELYPAADGWCGTTRSDFSGCLLDRSLAPAVVESFEHLQRLVHEEHYTPAVFLRDPKERILSMYTGTEHAQGVNFTNTSFKEFVFELEWGKYGHNEHMAKQMETCNFGRAMNASSIPWKLGSSTPLKQLKSNETTRRAHRFVADLFGEETLTRVSRGWKQCPVSSSRNDEFFSFDSQAKREATLADDLIPRIRALYEDDFIAYEESELQYGSQHSDRLTQNAVHEALVPLFVQTVPGR